MEEKPRVKNLETKINGIPLFTWIIDEDEKATLGGELIGYSDPAVVEIERKVIPTNMEARTMIVVSEQMEKAVAGRKDVFLYLFYKCREGQHPLFAILAETERKEVKVVKDEPQA